MRLYQLHDHLYVRGHTRHLNTSEALSSIRAYGIRLVMNVALINDPILAAACRTTGMEYRHEPLNDSGAKLNPERVRSLAKDVASVMEYGAVVVHCDSGWNRSGLIAILALMFVTHRPAAELIAEARAVRGAKLLWNQAFEEFLLSEPSR